jgi:hypothetical protein
VASATAAPLSGEAHIYRRSTAVLVPRSLSSQGTQPRARLPGTWRGHVLRIPLSGITRPCLSRSPARTAHPGRSAEGLMPKAARARVASPPAGAALARAIRGLPPGPRPTRARFANPDVTISVTIVNIIETKYFQASLTLLTTALRDAMGQCLSSSFRRKISQKLHDRAHPRRADQIAMHDDQQFDRKDLL